MATILVKRQDADFAINPGKNNESSIKFPKNKNVESLFYDELPEVEETKEVSIKIFKPDLVQAAARIISSIPIYKSRSNKMLTHQDILELSNNFNESINTLFGDQTEIDYVCTLHYKPGRSTTLEGFIDGNRNNGVSIRNFLLERKTLLDFKKKDAQIELRISGYVDYSEEEEDGEDMSNAKYKYQEIFYGAPGTGKSHTLTLREEQDSNLIIFRTTFHPDYDYSSFVGSYKPITVTVPYYVIDKTVGKFTEGQDENGNKITEKKIVYDFREQVFLQAYLSAWQNPEKKVAIIIEELNRGNCAQIFGDVFQLLDRKSGFSKYPIKPNTDISEHLCEKFNKIAQPSEDKRNEINTLFQKRHEKIIDLIWQGLLMVLPDNLYIWATMNTSDQSLFPIDSAFKRRWEWNYVQIKQPVDNGTTLVRKIHFKNLCDRDDTSKPREYDWWTFLTQINSIIYYITESADKQLGFFFCDAKNDIISAKTFVDKVIFFLWNDVFKNEGFDDKELFTYCIDENTKERKMIMFTSFYNDDNSINEDVTAQFIENVLNKKIENQ